MRPFVLRVHKNDMCHAYGQPSDRGHELDPIVESSPSGGGCSHNGIVACVALAMLLFCVVQTAVLGPGGSITRRDAFDAFV